MGMGKDRGPSGGGTGNRDGAGAGAGAIDVTTECGKRSPWRSSIIDFWGAAGTLARSQKLSQLDFSCRV
jgi:hypothetical protein